MWGILGLFVTVYSLDYLCLKCADIVHFEYC